MKTLFWSRCSPGLSEAEDLLIFWRRGGGHHSAAATGKGTLADRVQKNAQEELLSKKWVALTKDLVNRTRRKEEYTRVYLRGCCGVCEQRQTGRERANRSMLRRLTVELTDPGRPPRSRLRAAAHPQGTKTARAEESASVRIAVSSRILAGSSAESGVGPLLDSQWLLFGLCPGPPN